MESLFTNNAEEQAKAFELLVQKEIEVEDLVSLTMFLRQHMIPLEISRETIDTCGTGGSSKTTINTSTIVGILLNALGLKVAKHGNRSASGRCGSFDLLESVDIKIELTLEEEKAVFEKLGLVFIYARSHHPILARIAELRRAHGKRTIFNLVGPLCNPAKATRHVLGVSDLPTAEKLAESIKQLAAEDEECTIVSGLDGLDEVTICEETAVFRVKDGAITKSIITPEFFGIKRPNYSEISGGDCETNKAIFQKIIEGKGTQSQKAFIAINGALGLNLAQSQTSLKKSFDICMDALNSDICAKKLQEYKNLTS